MLPERYAPRAQFEQTAVAVQEVQSAGQDAQEAPLRKKEGAHYRQCVASLQLRQCVIAVEQERQLLPLR